MARSFKMKQGITRIDFPNGSVLADPNKILTGEQWGRYVPEFLEEVLNNDITRMITEELPDSTPVPAIVNEITEVNEDKDKNNVDVTSATKKVGKAGKGKVKITLDV